ncbi:acrylyl-CoA reductase (NADPH) [Alteromonas lipolytica]|uniref:Alcohol dehydrogenase n=1 Tax=Alteromonas lipolytica TaxID=1856405 RepID=A0A1E8FHF5_9ALTE|nr:MDR family oxidoreductase [Alteromonas lipolytica]OFI35176.1 alcohol dehydrogenase [Alteromonas lipolytica]GGF57362.1 alcohol dehydrogenase [Alteromonas lipolytica]
MFNAIYINKDEQHYSAEIKALEESALPDEDVLINVDYSTLNYKDALAITGKSPVVRQFPLVAGIDLAGTVAASRSDKFKAGDKVLVNGWGLGEQYWGGLAQKASINADFVQLRPPALSSKHAMAVGTAGYTAMLCVIALESQGVTPDHGEILVTGANGGVGTTAIAILAKLGYDVVASTGRLEQAETLKALGAKEVIDRALLSEPGRPLAKERWAGVVDSVGSHTLANACAATKSEGAVAACGLAQGMDFPATVAPFILRGVKLLGINSVTQTLAVREKAWARVVEDLPESALAIITRQVTLAEALTVAPQFLSGQVQGRVVVDVNA